MPDVRLGANLGNIDSFLQVHSIGMLLFMEVGLYLRTEQGYKMTKRKRVQS
jgi:hypothetical protein